jgi:hypothetical protein
METGQYPDMGKTNRLKRYKHAQFHRAEKNGEAMAYKIQRERFHLNV